MNAECAWVCCVLGGMSELSDACGLISDICTKRVEERVLVSGTALCGACAWGLHAFLRKVPGYYIFEGGGYIYICEVCIVGLGEHIPVCVCVCPASHGESFFG